MHLRLNPRVAGSKGLNFRKRKAVCKDSPSDRAEKDRLIAEFMATHQIQRCEPASGFASGYEEINRH